MTSIIILSYNTLPFTQLCVRSIRKYTKDYELIVIDNNSRDGSREWLQAQPDIKLILNDYNVGFPAGCNQGLTIAGGDELLLLNSDTVVTYRWLDNLRAALHSGERIGAVSCVANNCSNFQQIDTDYQGEAALQKFARKHNRKSDPSQWEPKGYLVMFCFLMKREVYNQVGPLDERFTPGNYEDDDYSLRIWQAGYELLLCHDTFIHHHGSASFGTKLDRDSPEFKRRERRYYRLMARNREMLIDKWKLDVMLTHFRFCTPDIVRSVLADIAPPPLNERLAALARGNNAFQQGKYEIALNEYERILQTSPDDPETLFNMGLLARELGNEEDARQLIARSAVETSELLRI